MFNLTVNLLKTLFSIIFRKRKDIILTLLLIKRENQILKRNLNQKNKKIKSDMKDRLSLSLIAALSKRAIGHLTLVKPKTLLDWQRKFIKKGWTYP
jgi:putative transposase